MNVSGNYSNYGQVGQQYDQYQQDRKDKKPSTDSHSIAYTSVTITQDEVDFSNYGLRYDKSNNVYDLNVFKVDALAGATVAGHTGGNFHSSAGVGVKGSLWLGSAIALYGSATGTVNYTLSGSASQATESSSSFGAGYRLAYGAEIKAGNGGIYGEMFSETATNYEAKGYAIGAKIYF